MNIESKHFRWVVCDTNGWEPGTDHFAMRSSKSVEREMNLDVLSDNPYNENFLFILNFNVKDNWESVFCEYFHDKKRLTIGTLEFRCSFKQADKIIWKMLKEDNNRLKIPPIHKKGYKKYGE